jgi:hypothetical protein
LGLLELFRLENCFCCPVLRDSMQVFYQKKRFENELLVRGSCLDFWRLMAEFPFLTLDYLCEMIERFKWRLRSLAWIWSHVSWKFLTVVSKIPLTTYLSKRHHTQNTVIFTAYFLFPAASLYSSFRPIKPSAHTSFHLLPTCLSFFLHPLFLWIFP